MMPNIHWVILAAVAALASGAFMPAQALLMSEVRSLGRFSSLRAFILQLLPTLIKIEYLPDNSDEMDTVMWLAFFFVGLGVCLFLSNVIQHTCIEIAGNRLVTCAAACSRESF
jgi:hypothetical protein